MNNDIDAERHIGLKDVFSLDSTWSEIGLVALPILVICLAVLFSPPSSKSFIAILVSKPEWYFLTLVFCIEAHRDRGTTEKRDDLGIIWISLAACLAAWAAAASISSSPIIENSNHALSNSESRFEWISVASKNTLSFLSIPIFVFSVLWSALCKMRRRELDAKEMNDNKILLDVRRPRIYSVDHQNSVKNFYNAVAGEYNKRNDKTKGIRDAQDQIIDEIRTRVRGASGGEPVVVLDIGGGTGHNVYNTLRSEKTLSWISLDLSPGMTQKFHDNFPCAEAITGDCLNLQESLSDCPHRKYDAVVLSFALSSMPRNVDFKSLGEFLKPGGCVLVADIHPGYVAKSPCFDIEIRAQTHALKLRKVEPLVMEHEAAQMELLRSKWELFENERGEVYSYFVKFERKAAVTPS